MPHYGTVNNLPPSQDDNDSSQGHRRRRTDATTHLHSGQDYRSRSPIAHRGDLGEYTEQDPFLPPYSRSSSPSVDSSPSTEPSRRPKIATLWILPVVALANLSRGMTMAPRIEVYTQIACNDLHSTTPPTSTSLANVTAPPPLTLRDFQSTSLTDSSLPSHILFSTRETSKHVRVATLPKECLHDPAVQSRAAEIQATLGTVVGVLSIATAGYWGQFSDAFGRKKALGANLFGMSFHDIMYILVATTNSIFSRHAWAFLVLGPVFEGLLGGLTTLHAAQNAFLADCAPSGSRSTIFAYYQGVIYISLALGPQLAGIVLGASSTGASRPVFYLGFAINVLCFFYALFVLPESVTPEMMHAARHPSLGHDEQTGSQEKWIRRMRTVRHRIVAPLTMFGPQRRPGGGWDLNLMFLVIAQLTHLMSVGVVQVKFLYAQHRYAWTVKQLGYYISLLWTLRAFHLLLLLPAIVYFVKPKPPVQGTPNFTARKLTQDLKFDYRIAQFSILIDTLAYVLTLIAPASSQALFISFTSLSSFTAGVNPAIHSLAVSFLYSLNSNANVGQMFGGMSMLQAVAHTMQPLLFGLVYSRSVSTFPKAIFALAAGLLLASVALLTLLRTNQMTKVQVDQNREGTRIGISQVDDEEGGGHNERTEVSKPLLGNGAPGSSR